MELFNLAIIVPIGEVLLLEILLELLPHNLSVIDLLHFHEVLPPYRCSFIQIEYGYPCLHISILVLDLEILSHPKKPRFSFLTRFYLTIKCREPCLLNSPCELFLYCLFLLQLWDEEIEPSMDSLESDDPLEDISRVYVLSLETLLELLDLLWEFLLAELYVSTFQPQYVDGLLNPSHRILSFTTMRNLRRKSLLHLMVR